MMARIPWRIAPAIVQWREEVNRAFPGRSKVTDGIIGDAAHSSRLSDHNPNPAGYVCAMDTTLVGVNMPHLIQKAIGDGRTNYFIFNRTIWSRSKGFVPRTYLGPNPHTKHGHLSVLQSPQAYMSKASWGIGTTGAASAGGGGTKPGLPTTGDGPTTTTPKGEITVSEANRIIAELTTLIKTQSNANNELLGGRPKLNQIGSTAADYVAKTGFSRPIIELNGEAAGRHAANAMRAQINELRALLADIKKAGNLTDAQVDTLAEKTHTAALLGSEQGAKAGVTAGINEVTNTWNEALREILAEFAHDLGAKPDRDLIEQVMAELAARVAPEAVAK